MSMHDDSIAILMQVRSNQAVGWTHTAGAEDSVGASVAAEQSGLHKGKILSP
jgi:hypothetical protein